MTAVMEVRGLTVAYGGVVAVRDISFDVQPGEVLAVLGANGAGKTSTLRAVTGLVRPARGSVRIGGRETSSGSPEQIARLGVAHVPAGRGIFGTLSVGDNLRLGLYGAGADGGAEGRRRVQSMLDTFPVLAEKLRQPAGQLSGGQQQQLAIARALVQSPRLLLLDEMSMGLSPTVVADLFRLVAGLRDEGIAVVMVEQFVGQALRIADSVLVLEQGRIVAAGAPSALSGDAVAAAYLGGGEASAPLVVPPPPVSAREGVRIELGGRRIRELERLAAARGTTVSALLEASVGDLLERDREVTG